MNTTINNFSAELIQKINSELEVLATDKKLKKITEILQKELATVYTNLYIKVDEVYLECVATSPQKMLPSIRIGEGLMGNACQKNHVTFATTTKNFKLAIPIKKWAKAIGVLEIIYSLPHEYNEEEINLYETICLLLSEIISSHEISAYLKKIIKSRGLVTKSRLKGTVINKGYGIGNAIVHQRRKAVIDVFAKDKVKELENLEDAKVRMNEDLSLKMQQSSLEQGEHIEILDAYIMIANDKGWYKRITNHINLGLTAEAAVEQAYSEMWERLSGSTDAYLKERLHDLRDIADRLRLYLSGEDNNKNLTDSYDNIIIVASSMGPADLMDYDYTKIRGLVIEECTPTMHVAIVAKALNVPVIAQIQGIFNEIKDGETIAIDESNSSIYINPTNDTIDRITKKLEEQKAEQKRMQKLNKLVCKTKDKKRINLYINIGLDFDFDFIKSTNCDGVGLYRTEIPFMSSTKMPKISEQTINYKKLYQAAGDKKVIFRSLDVGSDKLLPYWNSINEENPAIGWRSIRITLDRRTILQKQMKAFIKAAEGKELNIMFPMISNLDEFLEAKKTFEFAYEKERKKGTAMPIKVNLGLMIEVPSVVFQLTEILKYCDFISVGTNDLYQFFFACDRGNPRLIDRYDVLSPPFLNLMKDIITKATLANKPCSVCGDMASSPLDAMVLLGLGYRNLSVASPAHSKVKAMIRSVSINELTEYIDNILSSSRKSLRMQLKAYAVDHNIEIY